MEISLDAIISILTLLLGGGGGAFFTWQYTRRRAKAEASQAESTAAKEAQEFYQKVIADANADREENRTYIKELKDDRRHLREERDELRKRIDELDSTVRALQTAVAKTGRKVECMLPFMCGRASVCPDRMLVEISDIGDVKEKKTGTRRVSNGKD